MVWIDCEQCVKYGQCKPDICNPHHAYSKDRESFSLFKAKTDDVSKYCPYCKEKLYIPWTKLISDSYKEKTLECRNQECWAVKDERKRREQAGEKITGEVWATVGYIEMQVRLKKQPGIKPSKETV